MARLKPKTISDRVVFRRSHAEAATRCEAEARDGTRSVAAEPDGTHCGAATEAAHGNRSAADSGAARDFAVVRGSGHR